MSMLKGMRYFALTDMGTTLSGLLVTEDIAMTAHVGDSRIYRLRRRKPDLKPVVRTGDRSVLRLLPPAEMQLAERELLGTQKVTVPAFYISTPPCHQPAIR